METKKTESQAEPKKRIIRIVSTDINSSLSVERALKKIKGIGFMFARAICVANKINPKVQLGSLNESQLKGLEETIKNPKFFPWLLNRRKDIKTNKDMHIVGGDISLKMREDIRMLSKIRAYRGIRHEFGLPVRGQRTHGGSFRKQKAVGVIKKKAAPAKKEEKK